MKEQRYIVQTISFRTKEGLEIKLNELGDRGWILSAVLYYNEQGIVKYLEGIFHREKA